MKRNKLLIAITTTRIYQYPTDAETEDVAFDEYKNQSGLKLKKVDQYTDTDIFGFNKGDQHEIQKKASDN